MLLAGCTIQTGIRVGGAAVHRAPHERHISINWRMPTCRRSASALQCCSLHADCRPHITLTHEHTLYNPRKLAANYSLSRGGSMALASRLAHQRPLHLAMSKALAYCPLLRHNGKRSSARAASEAACCCSHLRGAPSRPLQAAAAAATLLARPLQAGRPCSLAPLAGALAPAKVSTVLGWPAPCPPRRGCDGGAQQQRRLGHYRHRVGAGGSGLPGASAAGPQVGEAGESLSMLKRKVRTGRVGQCVWECGAGWGGVRWGRGGWGLAGMCGRGVGRPSCGASAVGRGGGGESMWSCPLAWGWEALGWSRFGRTGRRGGGSPPVVLAPLCRSWHTTGVLVPLVACVCPLGASFADI